MVGLGHPGERGGGDSTGSNASREAGQVPGVSQVVQGRRVMAVRCVFCHPEQPQDREDGVTCGWNEVLFGFKPWPGTGQN